MRSGHSADGISPIEIGDEARRLLRRLFIPFNPSCGIIRRFAVQAQIDADSALGRDHSEDEARIKKIKDMEHGGGRDEANPAATVEKSEEIHVTCEKNRDRRRGPDERPGVPGTDEESQEEHPCGDRAVTTGVVCVQVVSHGPIAYDEAAPRDRPTENIRVDQIRERPSLQVSRLDIGAGVDAVSGSLEPDPEVDVFDRRLTECLIEATELLERRPSDRAAAGPECRGVPATVLVGEVVEQILVSGDDPRIGRPVVV